MNQRDLRNYARMLIKIGVNVKKGQPLIVLLNVEDAYFAKYLVEEGYKAGASKVTIEWNSDEVSKLDYLYQDVETLKEIPDWKISKKELEVKEMPARLYIESSDPDSMNGIDQRKMMEVRRSVSKVMKKYRDQMEGHYQWCIASLPGKAWAKRLFPELSEAKAFAKLWDAIKITSRLNGDAVKNWEEHIKDISDHCDKLNKLNIKTLKYKASNGTDFEVSLTGNTTFEGGDEKTYENVVFTPNIPTEECFTSPDRFSANGTVYASKPLSYMGVLLKDFGFRFENGKVTEIFGDEKCKEVLTEMVNMDEGASRLGEVALVPFNSPVNETGIIFFNTLFDENACCHLALGMGFDDTIKNFDSSKMKKEDFKINDSMIHVDFMIGTADLLITATTFDNKEVVIFKEGTWAI